MRVGLVGYGNGGRIFHAPYIVAAAGCELAGIVTRSPVRVAQASDDLPGVPVFASLGDLLDAGVDAVAISTPPDTRRELVLEAVARGVHVIADKPFAPTAAAGRELVDAAAAVGAMLSVYHNRRWDTDFATLRTVVDDGLVGTVWRLDSRLDLDEPEGLEAGPAGGLLRDLGSHLVDQALCLLGPARSVSAVLDWLDLPAGRTDAGFVIALTHDGGAHSHLSGSKCNRLTSRELRLLGTHGSYVSAQSDVQTEAILAGRRPASDPPAWGYEAPERWGVLSTRDGVTRVPSAQGAYHEFYRRFAEAACGLGPQPVPGPQALDTLRVLDAARASAQQGLTITV